MRSIKIQITEDAQEGERVMARTEHPILFSGEMVRAILAGMKTQTRRIVDLKRLRVVPRGRVSSDLGFLGNRIHVDGGKRVRAGLNQLGAVFAKLDGEKTLGLKPGEFDFVCPYAVGETTLAYRNAEDRVWTIIPTDSRLWVRETWSVIDFQDDNPLGNIQIGYPAGPGLDYDRTWIEAPPEDVERLLQTLSENHKPSIHMPRWACRLVRGIVKVRLERLQDITEADAKAEGVRPMEHFSKQQRIAGDKKQRTRTHGSHPYTMAFATLWDEYNGDRAPFADDPWVWAVQFRGG